MARDNTQDNKSSTTFMENLDREVHLIIKHLKDGSAGWDSVSARMLKKSIEV